MQRVLTSGGSLASRLLFAALLAMVALSAACGGNAKENTATTFDVSPRGQSVVEGNSIQISADVNSANGFDGLTWTISGPGQLSNQYQNSVTYTAPFSVPANTNVVVTATTNSGSTGYSALTILPVGVVQSAQQNVQQVIVNGGPAQNRPNGGFTSVTICVPGTTTCSPIDGILVDTGSVGLRILASALPALPSLTDSSGTPISECFQFGDDSFVWGQVVVADVKVAGEVAGHISIHSIADPTGFSIPSACSNGAGSDSDSQQALGANGILGVGLEPQDCGLACDPSAGGKPPTPSYYSCSSSCTPTFVGLALQVDSPVVFFAADNNGVVVQFPPVLGSAPALNGTITFGIGTEVNNGLGSATIFTVDGNGNFTTQFPLTGQSLTSSFIDSGSSGLFFPGSAIPTCSSPNSVFFCPASVVPLTATTTGTNGSQSVVDFSVGNADDLLAESPTDVAFSALAGQNGTGTCQQGQGACSFDWGMPFFYGRSVFVAINGQPVPAVPAGVPPAPWWAYAVGSDAR